MAVLQCEICGGKLIGKTGGRFECDSCGMEYSTEWAKAKVQEIKGTVKIEGPVEVIGTVKVEGGASVEALLKRGWMLLDDCDWSGADEYFEKVLSIAPENGEAYAGKFCVRLQKSSLEDAVKLYSNVEWLENDTNFKRAVQFADDTFRAKLEQCLEDTRVYCQENTARLKLLRERTAKAVRFIAAGGSHTVGLKSDGTVVAAGYNGNGQCDVSSWRDIVAVAAGGSHTVGLKSDGTVVAAGYNGDGRYDVSGWSGIVAVAAGYNHTVGLKSDGSVVAVGVNGDGECNVSGWSDIVAVAAGSYHTVGLKSDGTVVAVGVNKDGQCDVSDWRDIVAVAAGMGRTVGLKSDGTVVTTLGCNYYGRYDVFNWRDIVAVAAGGSCTMGLKSDGTVVAEDYYKSGPCDVPGGRDIVAVAVCVNFREGDYCRIVGLKSDGTVVAKGYNGGGQCNVSDWKLFNSLDTLEQEREGAIAERRQQDAEAETRAEAERLRLEAERQEEDHRRIEAEQQEEERRRIETERQKKISQLKSKQADLYVELAGLKGLFSGGKRRELEARLANIEEELGKL